MCIQVKIQLGADDQQERLKLSWWIVGFTDGEGCFSVSIFRNKTNKLKWQVMPEFVITQAASSLACLQAVQKFFACGHIFINKRYDNHRENIYRYCVRDRQDLNQIIIPFFLQHSLKTAKKQSFDIFCQSMQLINQNEHLTERGLRKIALLTGKNLILESSETIR